MIPDPVHELPAVHAPAGWDPDVFAWVERRRADLEAREFEHALATVGPDKALGGQGFLGSREAGRALREHVFARNLQGRGLLAALRGPYGYLSRPGVAGGVWLYVWHRARLREVLSSPRARAVLAEAGWTRRGGRPLRARELVLGVAGGRPAAQLGTDLFDLIADLYGDKTGPGRSDVLPRHDRRELLAAYERRWGQPDPTIVYFDETLRPTVEDLPRSPWRRRR